MKQHTNIKTLLQHAVDLREQDKLEESLFAFDEVITQSIKDNNYQILIEALHGKTLTWKHFYLITNDNKYKILACDTAHSAMKICQDQKINNKLSKSLRLLQQ